MSSTAFFLISVLLLLWLLTATALALCLRRLRALSVRETGAGAAPNVLLDFATAKAQQAVQAASRLEEVCEALELGLAGLEAGRLRPLNPQAGGLLGRWPGEAAQLAARLRDVKPGETLAVESDGQALQFKRLEGPQDTRLFLIQDVTEAVGMARRLKENERFALLGQMTAHMAHQLKTPLAVLAGQAQMLARRLEFDEGLKAQAGAIFEEARGLAGQINDILAHYRQEREPRLERVDLPGLLAGLKRRLEALEGEGVVECQALEETLGLESDPALLESLLFLLGQNAFSPEVGAKRLVISATPQGEEVAIRIRDDGCGVSQGVREALFEPFVGTRADGLGLGLFLARNLARQLGGRLVLEESEPGRGACFLLILPRNVAA